MGHAASLYPEYRKTIRGVYVPPASCGRYCCGWIGVGGGSVNPAPGLDCITDRLERTAEPASSGSKQPPGSDKKRSSK